MGFGQLFGIPSVGLDLVSGLTGNLGGCHHNATVTKLSQSAHQDESTGAGFVAEVEFHILAVLLAQSRDDFIDRVEVVSDFSVGSNLSVAARFGDCNGDGLFVDIKADIE